MIIYLSLHCHHQNVSCIKMGNDKSHFKVSLIVRDKGTRQCPQTTTFEEKGEPKRNRTEAPLLTSLTPYRKAKPAHICENYFVLLCMHLGFYIILYCFVCTLGCKLYTHTHTHTHTHSLSLSLSLSLSDIVIAVNDC